MFKSKLNLYNIEWLDLVFSDRNKSYGAYDLRKHYNSNILKALFFTATFFTAGLLTVSFLIRHNSVQGIVPTHDQEVVINLTDIKPPEEKVSPVKKINKAQLPASAATQKAAPSQVMKVVPDELAKVEPKPISAQTSSVGLQDTPGDIPSLDIPVGGGNGVKGGTDKADNEVKNSAMLEKLPEFPGGMEAWSKFLSKNLRYPAQASSESVSGRVFMSFIVEKDGRITDIQILKAAGFGFDEEAKRVLKMAPQWKPGIQNGQAVRVRYTIPINFSIQE